MGERSGSTESETTLDVTLHDIHGYARCSVSGWMGWVILGQESAWIKRFQYDSGVCFPPLRRSLAGP